MQSPRRFLLSLCLGCLLLCPAARAVTVDWDTLTWTPGSLANSCDVDPAKAGADVTITVSGNTAELQAELQSPYPMTPAITPDFQGGLGAVQKTLCLADQHVGFHDITYTSLPEINPAWSAVGSCLLAAALILWHSAKYRK